MRAAAPTEPRVEGLAADEVIGDAAGVVVSEIVRGISTRTVRAGCAMEIGRWLDEDAGGIAGAEADKMDGSEVRAPLLPRERVVGCDTFLVCAGSRAVADWGATYSS